MESLWLVLRSCFSGFISCSVLSRSNWINSGYRHWLDHCWTSHCSTRLIRYNTTSTSRNRHSSSLCNRSILASHTLIIVLVMLTVWPSRTAFLFLRLMLRRRIITRSSLRLLLLMSWTFRHKRQFGYFTCRLLRQVVRCSRLLYMNSTELIGMVLCLYQMVLLI